MDEYQSSDLKELGQFQENSTSFSELSAKSQSCGSGTLSTLSELTPDYASVESGGENDNDISREGSYSNRQELASSQVANFALEAMYFLEELAKFQLRCNKIDSNLTDVLYQVIESISSFLDGDPSLVRSSDKTISHINFERNTIKKQYFCDICQETITNTSKALGKHINNEKHRAGMKVLKSGEECEIAILKKQRRLEAMIENNPGITAKMIKRKERQEKEKAIQVQNLPKKVKMFMLENFSSFLETSVRQAENMKASTVFNDISSHLKDALMVRFPKMKIFFFGSRANGLANANSDLNILIETGLLHNNTEGIDSVLEVLNLVKYLLKEKPHIWKYCMLKEIDKQLSLSARNIKHNIRCDIWVTRFIVYWETLLINHFRENLPIFQDVYLFIKYWMKETGLSKHFPSYVITWLLVFSLQAQRLLPPISFLQAPCSPILIGAWNANFSRIPLKEFGINLKSKDYDTACYLIKKFFQLYSTFDFERVVICPYLGYPIERNSLQNFTRLLPQYNAFVVKNPSQMLPMKTSVCLQNPFEQNLNIGDNVSKGGLKLFRQYCNQSLKILVNKKMPSTEPN